MIERICHIDSELEVSIFLFGARQTGKSTFLRQKFPDSIYIDLLDTTLKNRFKRRPSLLYEMLSDKEMGTLVIIDEIPEVQNCWMRCIVLCLRKVWCLFFVALVLVS